MRLPSIPAVDAAGGAYRERPIELAKTALLSIDMQNAEWSPERMTRARVAGSPEAPYLAIMEKIEKLFRETRQDRSRAVILKKELDRWDLYKLYEDRFLDLFKDNQ